MRLDKSGKKFIDLFKSSLKDGGFKCVGNRCVYSDGELRLEISFRNRWGLPISDAYLELSDREVGTLLQDDVRLLFPGYLNLRSNLTDEELQALDKDAAERVRTLLDQEIVPESLALSKRAEFLEQYDAGRFSNNGAYVKNIDKLR